MSPLGLQLLFFNLFSFSSSNISIVLPSKFADSLFCLLVLAVELLWRIFHFSYCIFQLFKKSIFGCVGSSLLHGLFSSCEKWGLLSSCSVRVSQCVGFSSCGAPALGCSDFSCRGSQALEHRLKSCGTWVKPLDSMWDLPKSDIQCVSYIGRKILYWWATREVLRFVFYTIFLLKSILFFPPVFWIL